jgi:hypothetical protein
VARLRQQHERELIVSRVEPPDQQSNRFHRLNHALPGVTPYAPRVLYVPLIGF